MNISVHYSCTSSQLRSIGCACCYQSFTRGKPKPKTHTKATWGRPPQMRAESNNHDKTLGQRGFARKCTLCSRTHVMIKELCPARGKTCDACKCRNHFRDSKQCSRTDVHTLGSDDNGPIFCHMQVRKQSVEMQVDCGSTVNILPKTYVEDKVISPKCVTLNICLA